MKKITLSIFGVLFFILSSAQLPVNGITIKMPKSDVAPKGTAYGLDSSIYYGDYDTTTNQWIPFDKNITISFDNQARITQEITYEYEDSQWVEKRNSFYTYNTNINVDETPYPHVDTYTVIPWNSAQQTWATDTITYFNLTPYTDHIFGGPIYEEKKIQADWDYTNNKIVSGLKMYFYLLNDSLYNYVVGQTWDTTTMSWQTLYKVTPTYDNNYNIQEILWQIWYSGQWINYLKILFTTDNNGRIIERIEQEFNGLQWVNTTKDTTAYDNNGNVILEISYYWDTNNNIWIPTSKQEYTYNSDNLLTEFISYQWDETNNNWIGNYKIGYSYTQEGWIEKDSTMQYDNTSSQWINSSKKEYTYNSNGDKTAETFYYWDTNNNQWRPNNRTLYTYDANNNLTEELEQYYSSTWIDNKRYTYSYDANNNLIDEVYQIWDINSSQWINMDKHEYFYSQRTTPVISIEDNYKLSLFPNPTHDYIKIQNTDNRIKQITISDVNGKVLYNNENIQSSEVLINMAQYGQGLYIIKIKDVNNRTFNNKVIVY